MTKLKLLLSEADLVYQKLDLSISLGGTKYVSRCFQILSHSVLCHTI